MPAPIHHTFGPFVTWRTLATLLTPRDGKASVRRLREELARRFDARCALFGSGREALLVYLRALQLRSGEEVIVQGFTCAVVPNAVHAAGGTAVYADLDPETLNLTAETVRAVITPRTRAVICQHTFGVPADVAALRTVCDEHQLALIEDCAHIIPDDNSNMGSAGDAVILSFGRDKAISGIAGGAVLVRHESMATSVRQAEEKARSLPLLHRMQLWLYPFVYQLSKTLWPLRLGKVLLKLSRWLHILPPIVTKAEKKGWMDPVPHSLPGFCATLALESLRNNAVTNKHRRAVVALYRAAAAQYDWRFPKALAGHATLQKFSLFMPESDRIVAALKQLDIYVDDGWRGAVVNPPSSDQAGCGYTAGTCPRAEKVAGEIISLPTHPTMHLADVDRLIQELARLTASV